MKKFTTFNLNPWLIQALLVSLLIAFSNSKLIDRMKDLDSLVSLAAFGMLFGWSWLIVFLLSITRSRWRLLWFFLVTTATFIGMSYEWISGHYFSLITVELYFQEYHQLQAVSDTFGWILVGCGLISLGLTRLLFWHGYRVSSSSSKRSLLVGVLWLLLLIIHSSILYQRGGKGLDGQPYATSVFSFSAFYFVYQTWIEQDVVRRNLTERPTYPTATQDIVLIVDESVRGDWLDINGGEIDTPFFNEKQWINLGVAASATNCSAATNLVLRTNAQEENPWQDSQTNPFIWQYAKLAGYRTHYLDAQFTDRQLQNHMTEAELKYIDHWHQFAENTVEKRDQSAGRLLHELLNNNQRDFIYVQKLGAHFPYANKFPQTQNDSDQADFDVANDAVFQQQNWQSDYVSAVHWQLTSFFAELDLDEKVNATLIYTSDHGQFFQPGGRLKSTHCNPGKVHSDEGKVPLLVWTSDQEMGRKLDQRHAFGVSHFQIAPTLITSMGYREAVSNLWTPRTSPPQFISNFRVRFGEQVVWNPIQESGSGSP